MGGTLTYNKVQRGKSDNEKMLAGGGEFPICKGFYPDCPEKPSLIEAKCRNCPQADEVKKPKLEWFDCEHCGEDAVPVAEGVKKEDIEDTKCHVCGKINLKDYVQKNVK